MCRLRLTSHSSTNRAMAPAAAVVGVSWRTQPWTGSRSMQLLSRGGCEPALHPHTAQQRTCTVTTVCVCVQVRVQAAGEWGVPLCVTEERGLGQHGQALLDDPGQRGGSPSLSNMSACCDHTPPCPAPPLQLSLQLQQCTEFWSEKVRLLSSQLEEKGKTL